MIIVTGATGKLGRALVKSLLRRVSAECVGVSVRDPQKAADLQALGVRIRQGDFDQPQSLSHAFEGVDQLLLISSNARAYGGDTLAQHRLAIEAARSAGAQRIVYTSQMAAHRSSAFPPMLDHAATEEMLAGCGLPWTALRNGFYASSGVDLMGNFVSTGQIAAPVDGKVAWTAHADLAEAAAVILTGDQRFEGPTPPLTASKALDMQDAAEIASGIVGRVISREVLSDEKFSETMRERGAPEAAIKMLLGLYTASRNGEFATVDPTLERLIGRAPLRLHDVLSEQMQPRK